MSKVRIDPSGCWIWVGAKFIPGYGLFKLAGKQRQAHRVLFVWLRGEPHATLDHLCRVHACVNPSHLEPCTNRENVVVRGTGPSAQNAAKTHCKRGHPFTDLNTYLVKGPYGTLRACRTCRTDNHRDIYRRKTNLDPAKYRKRRSDYQPKV